MDTNKGNNMLRIVKVASVAEIAQEFLDNAYASMLQNYMLEDEDSGVEQGEIVGTEVVDTVMWMADYGEMRCYAHCGVEVLRDSNGELWITEEQETELFL